MPTPEELVRELLNAQRCLSVSRLGFEHVSATARRNEARDVLIVALEEGERAKAEVARLREAAKGQLVVVHHATTAIAERDRLAAEMERLRGALDCAVQCVSGGLRAVNAAIQMTQAEAAGHERTADRLDKEIWAWIAQAKALVSAGHAEHFSALTQEPRDAAS